MKDIVQNESIRDNNYEIQVCNPRGGVNWDSKNYSIYKEKLNANIIKIQSNNN